VAGLLAEGRLSEADRDYLVRALKVVRPADDVPVPLPPGRRDSYPAAPEALIELAERHGVKSSCERLLKALNTLA
jgi:hypothetical protein